MYYDYSNSEAGFLSTYMASKLEQGGEPEVTIKELKKALSDFISSSYYSSGISEIKKLKFGSAEWLAKDFQEKAGENRSWLKACFEIKGDKLVPTYNFFDFVGDHNSLASFLWGYKFQKAEPVTEVEKKGCGEATKTAATITAKYITKFYAKKYIKQEEKYGRWPSHKTDISNIFKTDLGAILGLDGTREYFLKFYHKLRSGIAKMIENENGNLILSNQKLGNLAYNNLKRLLAGYENFDNMNTSDYYELNDIKFKLEINNGSVKANETALTFSDPYGEWSDDYSNKTKTLSDENEDEFEKI